MANTAWAIRVGVDLDTSDIQSQLNKATKGTKVNLDTNGAQGSLDNLNSKFNITYQMANKIYQMSKQAISAMVQEVYTVDKALTEFKKVSDLRGIGLQEYSQELAEAGQGVARTMSDMIEAATMFRKSGFNDEEAKQLATMATMFQNISDVEVSAGQAASSIVSQLQAFGRGVLEPIHILDAYNKVAAEFAVGTNDLSQAMEISAAGMATYNNSFEQTIGLITSGTEIMVGRSSQVARGLNTIAANIVKNSGVLEQYGIQVKDSNGNLKSTFDVLKELKPVWDNLSDAERNALGITLAGKNQYRVLASIMTNFDHAIEATEAALNSEGTALAQNAAYMESLEAKTTRIKALFQELAQNVIGSDMVNSVLSLSEAFLKLANTPLGGFITQVGLLSGVLSGIYGMVVQGFGLMGILPSLAVVAPYILGIVAALVALSAIIGTVKRALEEEAQAKIFDNVATKIEESEKKIKEYENAINDAKSKLNELNSVPFGERTPEINAEIARLEALIKSYEILKKQEEERQKTVLLNQLRGTKYNDGATISTRDIEYTTDIGTVKQSDIDRMTGKTPLLEQQSVIDAVSKSYGSYEEAVYGVVNAVVEFDANLATLMKNEASVEELANYLNKKGITITATFHDWNEELTRNKKELSEQSELLENSVSKPTEKVIKQTKDLISSNKEYYDILKMLPYEELSEQEKDFIAQYERLQNILAQTTIGVDTLREAREKLRIIEKSAEMEARYGNGSGVVSLEEYVKALKDIEGIDLSNIPTVLSYLKNIGVLDLEYTDEELQAILLKLKEIDTENPEVDVDVDTEDAEEAVGAIEELEGKGITITSSSDIEVLNTGLETLKKLIGEVNALSINIDIKTNADTVLASVKSIKSTLSGIPRSKSITLSVIDYASETLLLIKEELDDLKDKEITVSVKKKPEAKGTDYFEGGTALINDGAPINGSAAELVVADGEASIYNDGKPTLIDLPRGAKIYNAAETQAILGKLHGLKESISAFGDGNVTIPSDINANNIIYDPSEFYQDKGYTIKKNDVSSFDKWLKERKHLLELDLITEEQYYLDLEKMNEEYLKNNKDAQDKYWQYQEEVYKWKKAQIGAENDLLERQLELEKALADLSKAQSQKILVFKDGHFQYMADIDAISEAQKNLEEIRSGYANGTMNATAGVHLVGEKGPELRVLNSGDKILSNDLTKNLLEIAKMGANGFGNMIDRTKEMLYSFNIGNITLPNVSNAEDFLNGLKNYAYQYSYS